MTFIRIEKGFMKHNHEKKKKFAQFNYEKLTTEYKNNQII